MTDLTTTNMDVMADNAPEIADMYYTAAAFELGQRLAKMMAAGSMLPAIYHNNVSNCATLIQISHAFRHMGVTPFMVAQQLVPVNGKFGWQGQFVAAVVNASKRFAADLQYRFDGEGNDYGCTAWTTRKDGTLIEGTKIDWKMVKAEGWDSKNGSKWKTMPEQMFRYRAASFFGKAYIPDLLQGFQTAEELEDMKDITGKVVERTTSNKGDRLTEMLKASAKPAPQEPEPNPEPVVTAEEVQEVAAPIPATVDDDAYSADQSLWADMELARKEREAEQV